MQPAQPQTPKGGLTPTLVSTALRDVCRSLELPRRKATRSSHETSWNAADQSVVLFRLAVQFHVSLVFGIKRQDVGAHALIGGSQRLCGRPTVGVIGNEPPTTSSTIRPGSSHVVFVPAGLRHMT